MQRPLLPEDRTDPAIREVIARNHRDIIEEVERAVVAHDVVVVGMKQNPFPRRARKALTAAGVPFHDLEYGGYLSTGRRRAAEVAGVGRPAGAREVAMTEASRGIGGTYTPGHLGGKKGVELGEQPVGR